MDKQTEILVAALRLALARPGEQRLYKAGKLDGLFGRTGPAGDAAQQALRDGLLEIVRAEAKGKATIEWVQPTPRGVEFLHRHESPVRALHDLRETLHANRQAIPLWLDAVRNDLHAMGEALAGSAARWVEKLEELTRRVDDALRRIEAASPLVPKELLDGLEWSVDAVNYLDRRRNGGATDACPLPELFAALRPTHPALTLGGFQDGLRRLHERRVVQLRPAAGDLDEPEFALPIGGVLMYAAAR